MSAQDELAKARAHVEAECGPLALPFLQEAIEQILPMVLEFETEAELVSWLDTCVGPAMEDARPDLLGKGMPQGLVDEFEQEDVPQVHKILRAALLDRWRRARVGGTQAGRA